MVRFRNCYWSYTLSGKTALKQLLNDHSTKQIRRQSCQQYQGAQFNAPKTAALGGEYGLENWLPTSSQHPLPPVLNLSVFFPTTSKFVNVKLLSYPLMVVVGVSISCSDMCSGLFIRLDHEVKLEKMCMYSGLRHSTPLNDLDQSKFPDITWEVCCRARNQV